MAGFRPDTNTVTERITVLLVVGHARMRSVGISSWCDLTKFTLREAPVRIALHVKGCTSGQHRLSSVIKFPVELRHPTSLLGCLKQVSAFEAERFELGSNCFF